MFVVTIWIKMEEIDYQVKNKYHAPELRTVAQGMVITIQI